MIEKRRITRESPIFPLPKLANTASKTVELTPSAIPLPLSSMPNALPCSVPGAQFRVALIMAPQKVREQVIPQNPWTAMDSGYEGKVAK